MRVFQLN